MKTFDKCIINFDSQGWPILKMSLKDIIATFMNYNPDDKAYWIKEDDPRLELFPRVLEDDGMGYGVNEKKICSFDIINDQYVNVFVEKELENIELWKKCKFCKADVVRDNEGNTYYIENIKEENGKLYLICIESRLTPAGIMKHYLVTKAESELKFPDEQINVPSFYK